MLGEVRYVECPDCGTWEEQDIDDPRHKIESFRFLSGDTFVCKTCSSVVQSEIVKRDGEDDLGEGEETNDTQS